MKSLSLLLVFVALACASQPSSDQASLAETEAWRAMVGAKCQGGDCPGPLSCQDGECCPQTQELPKLPPREIVTPIAAPRTGAICGGNPPKNCTKIEDNCVIVDQSEHAEGYCFPNKLEAECGGNPQRMCPDHYECVMKTTWPTAGASPVGSCILAKSSHKNPAAHANPYVGEAQKACTGDADTRCPEVHEDCSSRSSCAEGYECVFPDADILTNENGKCHPKAGFMCKDPEVDCKSLGPPSRATTCGGKWQCAIKKCVWLCPDEKKPGQTTSFFL
jgi:hypothetical protein